MKYFLTLIILLGTTSLWAYPLTKEQKLDDLHQLAGSIRTGYGPLQYKKKALGVDLEKLVTRYETLVQKTANNKDFYYLLVQFAAEFHDGHFSVWLPVDHEATTAFTTTWIENKVIVENIDDTLLDKDLDLKKGDEILAVNGVPVSTVLNELAGYIGNGNDITDKAIAAQMVTSRKGHTVPVPTNEQVTFKVIREGWEAWEIKTKWKYEGTPLDEFDNLYSYENFVLKKEKRYKSLSLKNKLIQIYGKKLDETYLCSGKTRIKTPSGATVIMEEPFVAYYHKTSKGNIGYLRIPHYSPEDENGEEANQERFEQYKYAVSILEENTRGLVIDQDHNCGGSIDFLHQLMTLFIKKPVRTAQFSLLATKAEYLGFRGWLEEITPNTRLYRSIEAVANKVKRAWMQGKFMTDKTSIDGVDYIYPDSEVNYTKPILILADYQAGSGGDAFPALMQGNGRATLFGSTTAGMGGHVEEAPSLNYSGMKMLITKSLFYRPDGVAVENNGAVPDIEYFVTHDDFMNGFQNYQSAYLQEIFNLL